MLKADVTKFQLALFSKACIWESNYFEWLNYSLLRDLKCNTLIMKYESAFIVEKYQSLYKCFRVLIKFKDSFLTTCYAHNQKVDFSNAKR